MCQFCDYFFNNLQGFSTSATKPPQFIQLDTSSPPNLPQRICGITISGSFENSRKMSKQTPAIRTHFFVGSGLSVKLIMDRVP